MKELHVKSLLPVRLDKYLMDQFPALGMGELVHQVLSSRTGSRLFTYSSFILLSAPHPTRLWHRQFPV